MKKKNDNAVMIGSATAATVLVGAAYFIATKKATTEGPQKMRMSHTEKLIEVVRGYLPNNDSILQEPDERWDWILGGRKSKDTWGYYEWITGAKYGTTCGIFAAACLSKAGFPRALINRSEPEGSGYVPTMHIARLYQGSRKTDPSSLVQIDKNFVPQNGDVYCQIRDTTWQGKPLPAMEHVGIFLDVKPRDGFYDIETADGGQTAPSGRQCAKRVDRILRGQTLTAKNYGTDAKLVWVIRAPSKG